MKIASADLMRLETWPPLPACIALAGDARFFREAVEHRLVRELFGESASRSILKVDASRSVDGLLARVLDELRTLSILSPHRLVVVESAQPFLEAYRKELEPFVGDGFAGGHLVLHLDSLDARTRFARALEKDGWIVECRRPFDRPPPWKPNAPPWQNPLAQWIVEWAARKRLKISIQDAYHLQERVGADLGTLDATLDKLRLYLGSGRAVDAAAIDSLTEATREDTIFSLVDAFIHADRSTALAIADRLFASGYHPVKGSAVYEPTGLVILFIASAVPKLRSLRRAHAVQRAGGGPDRWLELRLTSRPFLERFRADLAAMPPTRIERAFDLLLEADRSVKSGGDPRTTLAMVLARG